MIRVGKITNTHGHKGAVKVQPLTDYPERFEELQDIYLVDGERKEKLTIESIKYQKNNLILEIKEIKDMNQAEMFKGKYLFIEMKDARPLPEGHFYIFQLIGLQVYEGNNYLGKIRDVIQTGSNDVYIVKRENGQKDLLIPALKQVVKKIDLETQTMQVELLEGTLDES
ncbi:MAG: 16S rRNA processing protein RimM [Clostridia bacterium]|nr:16S rRNA processing protein RimM [Clostridia bacterium]